MNGGANLSGPTIGHVEPCRDFEDFSCKVKRLLESKDRWIFRGQERDDWVLETTLDRACRRFRIVGDDCLKMEKVMIREFQRRLHHYTSNLPDMLAQDEWMSLMQHYGAPTRLLDFSYSPFVAAYFAFEDADAGYNLAVWAVNSDHFIRRLNRVFPSHSQAYRLYRDDRAPEHFNSVFMDDPQSFVLSINPFRLNERLAYQRGVFLCPGDVRVGFMQNLEGIKGTAEQRKYLIKFTIPAGKGGNIRDYALESLDAMNINRITLFPGLDGFARSFSARIPSLFRQQLS